MAANPKGVTWADDEEPSAIVRLPEYAELERLGLGEYGSDGCSQLDHGREKVSQ